jgi:hypothetical protein
MRAFGFKHELVDMYSSLYFSGGSVTLAALPVLGLVYSVVAYVNMPIGTSGQVLSNGAASFTIDAAGKLVLGTNVSTGTVRNRGWCQVGVTCDGVNTFFYCDGEIIGQSSANAVALAGGVGSIQLPSGSFISDVCIAATALSQAKLRELFYTEKRSGLKTRFALDEGIGAPTDSVGTATAALGANVAWSIRTPKSPPTLPIDSGSLVLDGSTNAQMTIAAGANATAFHGITGGAGVTFAMWLKAHRLASGRTPMHLSMNGSTVLRSLHDPYVAVQPSRFTTARPAPGIGPADLACNHRTASYGEWAHMCVTIDCVGGVVSTYGDGVLSGRDTNATYQVGKWYDGVPYSDLRIGAAAGNTANSQWAGAVADIRFYRRALSKREVRDMYLGKLAPEDIQFKFREGSGNAAASSGSIALSAVVGATAVWSGGAPR